MCRGCRPLTCSGPMWVSVLLLCLPCLGSGAPLRLLRSLLPAGNASGPSGALPVTSTLPATSSEGPGLSLNLGLNFKIKVRSQGKTPHPASPTRPAALPHPQAPGVRRVWAEVPGGSGWPALGTADEELPSEPGGWAWEGTSARSASPDLWAPGPTAQPPFSLWPRRPEQGLDGDSKELEFKIDIDLTAGLGKEGSLASNGSSAGRQYPLLPGLRVGIAEIASKLGAPGLFGSTLPPDTWEPPEWNATGREDASNMDPSPGLESSSLSGSSVGSEGAFVALPGCLPNHPEDCGSPLPDPGSPPLSPLLLPWLPLFVPLHSDWNTAQAEWGLAWEAHLYGAGALFALLALLSLLALLALPCRCPSGCKLLALLHVLLVGAGGARALLLFGEAHGQLELLPDVAVRLMHDLALPCLTSALASAFLLLSRRGPPPKLSAHASLRHPCLLAALLLPHFSVAAGAALAVDLLGQLPFLLLASRGLFALLAAGLSSALLIFYCLARAETAQAYDLKSTAAQACQSPFVGAGQWQRAARTVLPAAVFGLLSAALQTYAILHALGYGLEPALFGPWPWWALQLACRLCEVGMGLPVACLGLCPLFCSPTRGWCPCCLRPPPDEATEATEATAKSQILPSNVEWALSQHEKLVSCDTLARSLAPESDYLPLYAKAAPPPACSALAGEAHDDPTADFQPPSPVDLRRSIDEALSSSEGPLLLLLRDSGSGGSGLYASGTFSCSWTREAPSAATASSSAGSLGSSSTSSPLSRRTASCVELLGDGGSCAPRTTSSSSPGPWRGGSGSGSGSSSPSKRSTGVCSLALGGGPQEGGEGSEEEARDSPPRSPPPPGRPYWALLTPVSQESLASVGRQPAQGKEAVRLQEEFLDVCRQIDTLSVNSETIDL